MSGDNWHTIRVPPEAYEAAKAQKEAAGRTWGEQLVRPDGDDENDDVDVDALADRLAACIDYPESQDHETIVARLDELESRLPAATADEVEGRLR